MDAPYAALGLWGLFASSFLSATLLPGNSEVVLGMLLHSVPSLKWPALAVATLGNTRGGLTSYLVGRLLPRPHEGRALAWLHRFGTPALLLSWLPFVGDALCVASGWLRQNVVAAALFIAIGKFVRYFAIAQGVELYTA
jgi:membrane protein YqaA with SNARE-associated domain